MTWPLGVIRVQGFRVQGSGFGLKRKPQPHLVSGFVFRAGSLLPYSTVLIVEFRVLPEVSKM